MGDLVVYKPQDISTAESLAVVRMDKRVPHYRDISRDERIGWLIGRIAQANMLRHQKADAQVLEMDAVALDGYIIEDIYISDFTLNEIDEAFRMGLINKYGDYYGVNAISLFGFLEGYFRSDKKQRAIRIVQAQRKKERLEKEAKAQRELARLEGWGVKVKTISEGELQAIALGVEQELKAEKSKAHRELVKQQAEEIRRKYGKE